MRTYVPIVTQLKVAQLKLQAQFRILSDDQNYDRVQITV